MRTTINDNKRYPLLCNGPINTHSSTTEEGCFPWGPCRGNLRELNSEAGRCKSTEVYNGAKRSTRDRMERVLVICEVGRLAIAL
jgi:hypothetical protein